MTPIRLLVFEFASGGGLAGQPLPPGLAREGDLMLRALLADLAELPEITLVTTRDPRLPPLPGFETVRPTPGEDAAGLYRRALARASAAWPIAPETDGMLEQFVRITLEQGKPVVGCPPDVVRLAGSKLATARALEAAGIPVAPTFDRAADLPPLPGRWVVKPDDGAGASDTVIVSDWRAARARLAAGGGRFVAQPWIPGRPLSLSLVCRQGRARLLACNRQWVRIERGAVTLERLSVNAEPDPEGVRAGLGARIAAALPGLAGYVGVDLVETRGGPVVLEINPRITTSYCGLREALGLNPAALVLAAFQGGEEWLEPELGPGTTTEIVLEPDHVG